MNSISFKEEYGVKEVPDVFICNANGDILYYSKTLKRVDFTPLYGEKWRCSIVGVLGNLEDWYNIPYDSNVKTFYFRTFKRNKNTGKDEPLCFAVAPLEILPQAFSFATDGDPFSFPIVFNFSFNDLIWLNDESCPKEIHLKDENFLMSSKVVFLKPEKTFKDVKIDKYKERLEGMGH